jgi:branched-chain amino acid transport system substrate-binding protein
VTRRPLALASALVLSLVLAACGSGGDGDADPVVTTPGAGGDALLVGSIASETGSGAPYGTSQLQGQVLAMETLVSESGIEAMMVNVDDRSTAADGVAAMEDLVDQGAAVVLGPTLSPVAAEADPVAQAAGVPVLAVTNTTLDLAAIGDLVWRVSLSEEAMVPQAVGAAQDRYQITTAALVYDQTDGYATGAADAFRSAAAAHGITLVADAGFAPGTKAAADALAVATAATPQALFLAARSAAAVELLDAAALLGLTQVLVGGNGFNTPDVLSVAGAAADGLIVAASWNIEVANPENAAFVAAYRERFGHDPDAFAAQGFAGIQLLLAAVADGGGTTPDDVAEGLAALGPVPTVLGEVRFEGREASYPAAVQVVRGERFVLL